MEHINSIPVSIVAPKKKRATSKRAARHTKKQDTFAIDSTSSPSPPPSAKDAKSILPKKERNQLARFIVDKFVLTESVVYSRDITIAYKLADRHPNLEFWKNIRAKRKINSLVIFWSQEARNRLTRQYKEYEDRLNSHRKLLLEKPSKTFIIGDKCGEDTEIVIPKPRSIKEFYQKYGDKD